MNSNTAQPVATSSSPGAGEPLNNLVPDVGALVESGTNSFSTEPGKYRVTGWIRIAPIPTVAPDDFTGAMLFDACQEIRDARDGQKKRMQFCLREEATHLALTGICGKIAPVSMCKVIGVVAWSDASLAEARASAIRLGTDHEMIF